MTLEREFEEAVVAKITALRPVNTAIRTNEQCVSGPVWLFLGLCMGVLVSRVACTCLTEKIALDKTKK